ncbi:MAG: hypothetical protein N3A69_02960 [Leptospiraceae bacterium]|nr:hypothetical protein [Leptospiraceae bacterium]
MLQFILQILEKNGISLDESETKQGSTHEKTMQEFLNLAQAKGEKKEVLDSFKASFKTLKRYRVQADYNKRSISADELKVVKKVLFKLKSMVANYDTN